MFDAPYSLGMTYMYMYKSIPVHSVYCSTRILVLDLLPVLWLMATSTSVEYYVLRATCYVLPIHLTNFLSENFCLRMIALQFQIWNVRTCSDMFVVQVTTNTTNTQFSYKHAIVYEHPDYQVYSTIVRFSDGIIVCSRTSDRYNHAVQCTPGAVEYL